jgi:hypothetical protein
LGTYALVFVAMAPCRIMDTRPASGFPNPFGPPSLQASVARTVPVNQSTCGVPSLAQAYSFNVTVVPQGSLGYLRVYPTGGTTTTSTLNSQQGYILANAAIVPAGTSGSVDVFASSNADLIIDINGYYAAPSDGNFNTALGTAALFGNVSGQANTALGYAALTKNAGGSNNVAIGFDAISTNSPGNYNTALGTEALRNISGGSGNIGVGDGAGSFLGIGDDNIYIGNAGGTNESGMIYIGKQGTHTGVFLAGVWGAQTAAVPVYIDASGHLGTSAVSSRRFKSDIEDMNDFTSGLMQLRPVTFHYKQGGADRLEVGLIAEEVAEVYPDLVVRGARGEIEGVRYETLAPMLLNEVQQQAKRIRALEDRLAELENASKQNSK